MVAKTKASKLVKQILKPGTYVSPDGILEVTPARLKSWAKSHKQMATAGYIVPSKWDHGKKLKDLTPLQQDAFKSAKNTVGKLVEFNVTGDGSNGAEIVMEISDPVARGRCERNEIEVSPVILGEFTGGKGDKYSDIIGHVDLVDYAVDRSQSGFSQAASQGADAVIACSLIRMSSSKSVFRLSSEGDEEESDEEKAKKKPPVDGDGDGEVNESESDSTDEDTSDDQEGGDESTEEESEVNEEDATAEARLARVVALLKAHDVALAGDVTKDNLLEHLETALATSAKKDGLEPEAEGEGDTMADEQQQTTIADPGYVAMSSLKKYADAVHSKSLMDRLNALRSTGRCTPAEHKKKMAECGTIRLSLMPDGKPRENKFTIWLEAREETRENSAFDATAEKNKSQLHMSSAGNGRSIPEPSIPEGDPIVMTRQQQVEMANKILAGAY